MKPGRPFFSPTLMTLCCALVLSLAFPSLAMALQIHGTTEGLYIHQGAHLFFALSMAGFAYMIHTSTLMNKRASRFMVAGALLLACWNIWAFCGHLVELFIPLEHFTHRGPGPRGTPSLFIATWKEAVYYMLKMDHLLCVPSLICFYLGIQASMEEFPGGDGRQGGR